MKAEVMKYFPNISLHQLIRFSASEAETTVSLVYIHSITYTCPYVTFLCDFVCEHICVCVVWF